MTISASDFWTLMKAFFEEEGLARQHLDSYDDFIENELQKIINEVGEIQIDAPDYPFKVKLGRIETGRPRTIEVDGSDHPIYPMEARLRNLTYAAPLMLEMSYMRDGKEESIETVHIGDIPVMLKSKLCLLHNYTPNELIAAGEDANDPGGYFIVNGSERVIVALEDLAPNRILVDIDNSGTKPMYRAKVFSTTSGFRARITCKMKANSSIEVTIPGVPTDIPFVVLMRALGIESDKDIAETISSNEEIQDQLDSSFEETLGINSIADAIVYIGNRVAHGQVEEYRLKRAQSVLDRNFMPHIGNTSEQRKEKAYFLGEMVSRIIELRLGLRVEDDKDHYANKRLKLAGSLLADLFRVAFRNLCRDIKYQLERTSIRRKKLAISAAVRHGMITERVQHALATGNWGHGRVGITQLLDRTNHISTLSHLRRLQSPLSRSQPNFEARDLHPTHWGRLCPSETPEGSNCGLVKNLSLMATISVNTNSEEIRQVLYKLGVIPTREAIVNTGSRVAKVFFDGALIGFCSDTALIVESFKNMRRKHEISSEANIVQYTESDKKGISQEIYVNCDLGRVRRPLIIIENGEPKLKQEHISRYVSGDLKWSDLVNNGIIEYLDAEEEENASVALDNNHLTSENTHLEIAPYTILGICTSTIPYAEHNQSPRNSYEAAMAKQALGVFSTNFANRVDTQSHILHYPQRPLVKTKPMDVLGYYDRPLGQNFVVAVLSFEGYNMEDAIVFNKSSIERGLARSTFYRVYKAEGRRYLGGLKDKFEMPESGTRGFRGEQFYRLLEEDGIVSTESYIDGNDVLIGRTSPPRFLEEYREFEVKGPTRRDTSITMRPTELGIVDDIFLTGTTQGSELVKVRVRDQRVPELGDKFASRHGQKGVIGMVVPQEDMPFTEEGVVPDAIINPHTLPSRMTIGQFIESIAGKAAALEGEIVDGTPFSNKKQEEIRETLQKLGFHYGGKEVMYNGITGEKFETEIFIGIVYYQKLHHMVADKIHARARGQVQMLTRQPTEGRARGGGLRFGEMERDCLIGHGAALLLKDRLLEESDKSVIYVCEKCGYFAYYDFKQRRYVCKICGEDSTISPITISYAFKLLIQELTALCIPPRLILKERA
ncbi:MAG: DNA-directed polymerase subunit [Thermoproteota archaeon]|nr:DNA-directed polymerase subunit [Thermoproteota archaeon]